MNEITTEMTHLRDTRSTNQEITQVYAMCARLIITVVCLNFGSSPAKSLSYWLGSSRIWETLIINELAVYRGQDGHWDGKVFIPQIPLCNKVFLRIIL